MQNLEKLKRWSNQKRSIGVKNLRMGKITKRTDGLWTQ